MAFLEGQESRYPSLAAYTAPLKEMERPLVGREKEMRSLRAAMMRPELCNVILVGDAGSGKAHPNTTLVPVADDRGYVPIGDIKVGDKVFDENGDECTVTGVFPRGLKHLYDVEFVNGAMVPCNDEHLWAVRNYRSHYKDGRYVVRELRDMVSDGITVDKMRPCGHKYKVNNWYVPANGVVKRPDIGLPVDPYVLGCFIGDGCCSDYPSKGDVPLYISSNDVDLVNEVALKIGSAGAVKNPHNYTWAFLLAEDDAKGREGRRSDAKYISRNRFSDMCGREYDCVFHAKSVDRRIPDVMFVAGHEQRMELLRGLLDTDGMLDATDRVHVEFCTNSEGLAHDVMKLAASLGISTSVSCNDRCDAVHRNLEYEIAFRVPDDMKPGLFHLQRYKDKFDAHVRHDKKFVRHYDDLAIKAVHDRNTMVEMTCIMVDSPSHLYQVTERHIVTHNTALVQGMMASDKDRIYLSVDPAKMLSGLGDKNEMAARIKNLFDETAKYIREFGKEVILFIDEFHQIVQLSDAAVEALKPMLADSGTRGIRVIAATTYVEFRKWVAPNQPLVERLQRFNLKQPEKPVVIQILKGMAQKYKVSGQFYNDRLFEKIYDYTQRYIPSDSQPRKSILLMDSMLGWNKAFGIHIDEKLLSDVIYETQGIRTGISVDALSIKRQLDSRVIAQELATTTIEQRLQICVADLNNHDKPMSSFLFCGSTGVGKTEVTKAMASILFNDEHNLIRFDMTEYALPESLERFRRELTSQVWARPYSIILLDEIEKAAAPVTRLLLQVLDDGRLIDENNREVTFKNSYVVLTTNAGSEIFENIAQYSPSNDGSGRELKKYMKLIRESIQKTTGDNRFPPELLGRIDCLVPFQPLSNETMKKIVTRKLLAMCRDVEKIHGIKATVKDDVVRYIVDENMDTVASSGGARAVVAKMESEVVMAVARYINAHPNVSGIRVAVGGQMAIDDKYKKDSDAYIDIVPVS